MDSEKSACSSSRKPDELNGDNIQIMDKLRVLCLHGYRQNSDSFKSKIGSFRKLTKKYAEFVFVTAPHPAPPIANTSTEPAEESDIDSAKQRSWWFNKDDGTFKGTNRDGPASGFEESLKEVEKVWRENGPFQGLLGFSQGACFAGLLCLLSTKSMTIVKPDFVILAAGFESGSLAHKSIYEDAVSIPSLHVFGENDEIIPGAMSEALAQHFNDPEILKHSGGHYLPASAPQKQAYINFFQDRLQEYLENKEFENAKENDRIELETK